MEQFISEEFVEEFFRNLSYPWPIPDDLRPQVIREVVNRSDIPDEILFYIARDSENSNVGVFNLTTQVCLIVAFAVLILFGATGNGLVCYVVWRNPHMRTPRNIFIINLAISDLTLCLFTQPFNLMKASMSKWYFGEFMCKFIPMCAGTNVFVSTISITAIALDRFQVIVYPSKDSMKKVGAAVALMSIWIISLLMASPLLIFNVHSPAEMGSGLVLYWVCTETLDLQYERAAYSIASMIFQYIVPIVIVSVAHARICRKLKYRMVNQQRSPTAAASVSTEFQRQKHARDKQRKRKTNMLLVMIAVVFACSWMPLNAFNIMLDFNLELFKQINPHGLLVPICHLLVLSSACTNPVLYGWLNENFRREFVKVLRCLKLPGCCPCCRGSGERHGNGTTSVATKQTNGLALTTQIPDGETRLEGDDTPDIEVKLPASERRKLMTRSSL